MTRAEREFQDWFLKTYNREATLIEMRSYLAGFKKALELAGNIASFADPQSVISPKFSPGEIEKYIRDLDK